MLKKFISIFLILCCSLMSGNPVFADNESIDAAKTISTTRLSGQTSYETAKAISEYYTQGKIQNVILATGNGFADALSASVLAHQIDAPILLVDTNVEGSKDAYAYISQHLNPNGTVYIIGGFGIIKKDFETSLKAFGFNNIVRIAGQDRYDTSFQLACFLNNTSTVVISSGESYPDALSIASFAANQGWPILLSSQNALPQKMKEYLSEKKPAQVYITGGAGVISENVKSEVIDLLPLANVERLAGEDRFDTNATLAQTFAANPSTVYLANGYGFADTLAGSVLAAKNGDPIIFIDSSSTALPKSVASYFRKLKASNLSPDLVVLGGKGVISDKIVRSSSDLITGTVHFKTREPIRNNIQNYLINYGTWTNEQLDFVKERYQLVIVDTRTISVEQVQRLRAGKDPQDAGDDVLVLGYLSVGEDSRTVGMTPEEMKKDSRFVLDGTGPSIDPRIGAPYPNGSDLPINMSIIGKPTHGGIAPFYLNDNFFTDNVGKQGSPDFNQNFKAAFVNPGHPEWLKALTEMKLERDNISGIKEILNEDYGAGFGCDGLFLDTLDTAAPNSYTDSSSANPSEFEWVAKGTQELLKNIRQMYPDKFLLANRGLFFYNPDLPAYKFTLTGIVDFVMFESFRLDSSSGQWFNELFFNDNKYNYAQKLMAEADRGDGFRVLSLGYAEGPEGERGKKALHGEANNTRQHLIDDVKETSALGLIHYLSNASVTDINTFVLDNKETSAQMPVWGSTKTPAWGKPSNERREGLQKVDIRGKDVFVQWDVAHSMARPLTYSLYIKGDKPFDFAKELESQSKRIELPMGSPPVNYAGAGDRTQRYPYEAKVEGLELGKTYYFLLRAKNSLGQSDQNIRTIKLVAP